jgi:hypothetical protein
MMDWLKQIAPTIATALGGPLAGLAVDAISKAVGIDPKDVQSTIDQGKLTSDQIAQLNTAEIAMYQHHADTLIVYYLIAIL